MTPDPRPDSLCEFSTTPPRSAPDLRPHRQASFVDIERRRVQPGPGRSFAGRAEPEHRARARAPGNRQSPRCPCWAAASATRCRRPATPSATPLDQLASARVVVDRWRALVENTRRASCRSRCSMPSASVRMWSIVFSRTLRLSVRTVPSSTTCSGITLAFWPPWIWPNDTTTASWLSVARGTNW